MKSASRTSHCPSVPRSALKFPGISSLRPMSATNSAPQTMSCTQSRGTPISLPRDTRDVRVRGATRFPLPLYVVHCRRFFMPPASRPFLP